MVATLRSTAVLAAGVVALAAAQPCVFTDTLIDTTQAGFDGATGFSAFSLNKNELTSAGWALGPYGNPDVSSVAQWTGLNYDCYSVSLTYWAIDSWDAVSGDTGSVHINGNSVWSAQRNAHSSCASDPSFDQYTGQFPNPWAGDLAEHKCFASVSNTGTLTALSSTFSLEIRGDIDQAEADESWAATSIIVAVGTTQPVCPITFSSDWLQTEYEPVLDVADSGFLKYAHPKDVISLVFDNPNKYAFQSASIQSASEAHVDHGNPDDDVSASSPQSGAYTHPGACYTRHEVHSVWGDVEPNCARDDTSDADFVIYTCKLIVNNKETLDPIRGTALDRDVISNIPYEVKFPKQVSASVLGLSAFQPPNVLAAIVRQEVIVNVNNLGDLAATIKLYTSTQWPFRLNDGSQQAVSSPTDIAVSSFVLETQCADASLGDVANPPVDDSAACGQIWTIELDVANGASGPPCELDGNYQVTYTAECQPSFDGLTDCPLVQDDLGQIQNVFTVDFKIDSEWFCPVVVHTVDVGATLHVWKDAAHSIAATNFIIGQTAYFETRTTSTDVTIVKAEVNRIELKPVGAAVATLVYSLGQAGAGVCQATDLGDTNAVTSLVVLDGPCEGAPADEAWFQFIVDETAVPAIPTDGSKDFEVSVTIDVTFKNAAGLLEESSVALLQTVSKTNSEHRASTSFAVGASDETTSSSTGLAVSAGVAAASVSAAMLL